jgi:holo-[acyl-carrier protein] synthase
MKQPMIISVGIDIADVKRIARSLKTFKGRFREKYFTQLEREYCTSKSKPAQHYAARFAAKEAVFKALGESWSAGTGHIDVEVVSSDDGAPRIELSNELLKAFKKKGMSKIHLSLSHTAKIAVAVVIVEG